MAFTFELLEIADVVQITPDMHGDDRGAFAEMYKEPDFKAAGIDVKFVQFNYSRSAKDVLRGMHYQMNPKAQGKLVSVTSGKVYDVVVDLREGSPTYGKWVSAELSAEKKNMLWVPVGFAHGFCVLSETAEVMYYVTDTYSAEDEGGIIWNDPDLAIDWPVENPVLSEKDQEYSGLKEAKNNFKYKS